MQGLCVAAGMKGQGTTFLVEGALGGRRGRDPGFLPCLVSFVTSRRLLIGLRIMSSSEMTDALMWSLLPEKFILPSQSMEGFLF